MWEKIVRLSIALDFIFVGLTISDYFHGFEIPILQVMVFGTCLLGGIYQLTCLELGTAFKNEM